MTTNESLLGVSQSFFSPDIVQKISSIIGQSSEKTRTGLKSVIPEFMSGLIDKGSTPEGAATLVDMVNTHNFESNLVPDETKLGEGNDVVNNIYGNNLNKVVSNLSSSTGLGSSSITKMMGLIAPVFMGIIGSKVKSEKLNLSGFMNFIKDQKQALAGFSDKTSDYYSLTGTSPQKDFNKRFSPISWKGLTLFLVIVTPLVVWWNVKQYKSPSELKAPVSAIAIPTVKQLRNFLATGTAQELPKNFQLEKVSFLPEMTTLAKGGEAELDYIAAVLNEFPNAKVRIISIAENVGTGAMTNTFANSRAVAIKAELIARGVKGDRIQTHGVAYASPGGSGTGTAGNWRNQRIELVVTSLK